MATDRLFVLFCQFSTSKARRLTHVMMSLGRQGKTSYILFMAFWFRKHFAQDTHFTDRYPTFYMRIRFFPVYKY